MSQDSWYNPPSLWVRNWPASTYEQGAGRIAGLLFDDISPKGTKLLHPFLDTNSLFRLSESARGLERYRWHVTRVKIVGHPALSNHMKTALIRYLQGQELGFRHLVVADISVLPVVALSAARITTLRVLDVSRLELTDQDAGWLSRILRKPTMRDLHELNLSGSLSRVTHTGMGYIRDALCQEPDFRLHRLILSEPDDYLRVLEAVSFFRCLSNLRSLSLARSSLHGSHGWLLAYALSGNAFPSLEVLDLSVNESFGDKGLESLVRMIEQGALPLLKELNVAYTGLGGEGVRSAGRLVETPHRYIRILGV